MELLPSQLGNCYENYGEKWQYIWRWNLGYSHE